MPPALSPIHLPIILYGTSHLSTSAVTMISPIVCENKCLELQSVRSRPLNALVHGTSRGRCQLESERRISNFQWQRPPPARSPDFGRDLRGQPYLDNLRPIQKVRVRIGLGQWCRVALLRLSTLFNGLHKRY